MAKRLKVKFNYDSSGMLEPEVVLIEDYTDGIGRTATRAEAHKYFDMAMEAYFAKDDGWEARYRNNLRAAHGIWCAGENNRRRRKTRRRPIGTGGDKPIYAPAIEEVRRLREKEPKKSLQTLCQQVVGKPGSKRYSFHHRTLAIKCRAAGIF